MKWRGDAAARRITRKLGGNLHRADEKILEKARELIGVQGPPRSTPGNPPHIDSSRLIDSLYDEVDATNLGSRIGSTEEHAVYTEVGTPTMAPRPWLAPACILAANDAARELAK